MKAVFNQGEVYWFHIVRHEDFLYFYVLYQCKFKNMLVLSSWPVKTSNFMNITKGSVWVFNYFVFTMNTAWFLH